MSKKTKAKPERIKQDPSDLPCKLTDQELLECGKKLANLTTSKAQLEDHKKRVIADYMHQIAAKLAEIGIETNKIETGVEHRRTNREAEVNTPEPGKKTVYRIDTGEVVGIQDMTLQELQRELPLGDEVQPPEELKSVTVNVVEGVPVG